MTVGAVEHAAVVRLNRCKSDPHHLGLRRRAMILVRAASPGKDPFRELAADDLKSISGRIFKKCRIVAVRDFRTPLRCFEIASSCAARQPGYAVNVFRIVSVECQAHFVWNMTRRFNYDDGFLHASLRDAVIHDVAVGLTLTAEAERF